MTARLLPCIQCGENGAAWPADWLLLYVYTAGNAVGPWPEGGGSSNLLTFPGIP